jgi:hypothetical protein
MHYSVPISINHRREICAELFQEPISKHKQHFIIEIADSDEIEILQINAKNPLTCFVINGTDIPLHQTNIQATLQGQVLQLSINVNNDVPFAAENKKTQENDQEKDVFYADIINASKPKPVVADPIIAIATSPTITNQLGYIHPKIAITMVQNEHGIRLLAQHASPITEDVFTCDPLFINLELHVAGQIFKHTCSISLVHPTQFVGIALDFGSESSQMATRRYEVNHVIFEDKPNTENLFQQIKLFYKNNNWLTNETDNQPSYYQEEKGSNFYKSLFFLKEQLSGKYDNIELADFIEEQQDNLKLLIDTNSMQSLLKDKYYQLPNLKIVHKHDDILSSIAFECTDIDGNAIPLTLKEIKKKVNNSILKTMVESFLQKEFIKYRTAKRYIRFTILVPNIYDTKHIQHTTWQLNHIFAELAKNEKYIDRLLGWEVQTISESDASFIGYINRKGTIVQPNKDYVIIDVGKGTTDFSVIRTGASNIFDLQPVYRNGFAGAGNLITNAIFETVLRYIRETNAGQSGVNKFIADKIIASLAGDDLVRMRNFYDEIERLKFNFKTVNIDAVYTDWVNATYSGNEWNNVVGKDVAFQTIIDLLGQLEHGADFFGYINDVCDIISEKTIAHLSMIKKNKKDSDIDGVVLTGRGFMFAPLADMMKTKLQTLLGIDANKIVLLNGSELKEICIKGVFNKSIQQNSDVVGYPIQIIKGKQTAPVAASKVSSKKWYEFLIGSIESSNNDEKIVLQKNSNLQMAGLPQSDFIIGSSAYNFGNKSIADNIHADSKATIDYTTEGSKVRRTLHGKVEKIIPLTIIHDYDEVELKLILPSLFPNYIHKDYLRSLQDELIGLPKPQTPKSDTTANPSQQNPLFFGGDSPSASSVESNDLLF